MRLCALLGIPSRRLLGEVLTHRDWLDWWQLWVEDPWGDDRADLRSAIAAAAAIAPYAKKGRAPRPVEFMPYSRTRHQRGSSDQVAAVFEAIAPAWNRTVDRLTARAEARRNNAP